MPWNSPKRPPYWILHLVWILTISPRSTCHSAPVCEILSKSDHPQQKKMTCRFLRWWISAILGFRGPIMGSLKSPCTISSIETIALNCLVFEKIAFFCMLATDRQTNKQTDGQHRYTKPLLLSRAAALKYIIHICTTGGTLFLAQYTCVLTSFHGSGRQMVRCTAN